MVIRSYIYLVFITTLLIGCNVSGRDQDMNSEPKSVTQSGKHNGTCNMDTLDVDHINRSCMRYEYRPVLARGLSVAQCVQEDDPPESMIRNFEPRGLYQYSDKFSTIVIYCNVYITNNIDVHRLYLVNMSSNGVLSRYLASYRYASDFGSSIHAYSMQDSIGVFVRVTEFEDMEINQSGRNSRNTTTLYDRFSIDSISGEIRVVY